MFFTSSQFDSLDEDEIIDFLEIGIDEFYYLDYKRTLKYKDHFKGEFLKDISAFANAFGGNLIYGVDEPKQGITIEDQIIGVGNANELIEKFEKLALAGLDPRIPGFKMKAIPLKDTDPLIIVHIPPSISKPHMIIYECDKKGLFYKRGIESNLQMNTQQIRNAVLDTQNTEERVLNTLKEKESEFTEYKLGKNPTFFFQATPLINRPPDRLLDITEIRESFHDNRRHRPDYEIRNNHSFSPIMHGFKAERDHHQFNVQHNGYMQSVLSIDPYKKIDGGEKKLPINSVTATYFKSVLTLTDDLIQDLNFDLPYLLSCKLFNARNTAWFGSFQEVTEFDLPIMKFTKMTRSLGHSAFEIVHNQWVRQLYNAFGLQPPDELLN